MRFLDEYRDATAVTRMAERIQHEIRGRYRLMEVCGGQTHSIVKYGLDQLLPEGIELIHGPGCPVCVTPTATIDQALALAARPEVIFCSFGDMLRVPGSDIDLLAVRAAGGDVRIVYSPLDAVVVAAENPQREVVFFAVGFETTAPANALAVLQAERLGLENFSLLVAQVLVPPAIAAIMNEPDTRIQGFLAAGHVCTVMGYQAYRPLVQRYRVPIAVTGFEPLDILQGVYLCCRQLDQGQAVLETQYARAVTAGGNRAAQALLDQVYAPVAMSWRGIGRIPASGLALNERYCRFDAALRFALEAGGDADDSGPCISGRIMQGRARPGDCPAFGTRCTPEAPLGAPMVSGEGACAAYYRYRGTGCSVEAGHRGVV